jgi:spore germination protein KC
MKKIFLVLFISCFMNGCSYDLSRKEIDEINLIQVLGIDFTKDGYLLSALYSTGGGSDSKSPTIEAVVNGFGKTPYEAYESLKKKSTKSISLAHAAYFLIGEKAAQNGIDDCIDFLSRDETVKMDALFYVTNGTSAQDFVEKGIKNKQSIHNDLAAIKQKQQEQIKRCDNSLVNLLNEMGQTYSSMLIPYLLYRENSFLIVGYAVFDHHRLADYLDQDTSDGIDFVKNSIRRYPIYIDKRVSLLVYHSKSKIDSRLSNGRVAVTIQIDFETMVKEVSTGKNVFRPKQISDLTHQQNQHMKRIIEKAAAYSKSTGYDILQISRMLQNQDTINKNIMDGNWKYMVSNTEYTYEFTSKITKSFILGNERYRR